MPNPFKNKKPHLTRVPFKEAFILCTLLFCLFPFLNYSQSQNIRFVNLNTEDGLADNYCHSIFMDSRGHMWFATQGGLSRYDGINFKNFKERSGDSTSITARVAMDIKEDKKGYLWIAMLGGGLNRYNPKTETFKTFALLMNDGSRQTNQTASKIYIDKNGHIWVGTYDSGIFKFDPTSQKFIQFDLMSYDKSSEGFQKNSVNDIVEDIEDSNVLWITGNNGLFRLKKQSEEINYFPLIHDGLVDSSCSLRNIFMPKAGELWLGTYTHGLTHYNIPQNKWQSFPHSPYHHASPDHSTNITYSIVPKSDSEFWVGSKDQGLMSFNLTSKTYSFYKNEIRNKESILSDDIEYLYKDRYNHIWIATAKSGVSMIDPSIQTFDFIQTSDKGQCNTSSDAEVYDAVLDTLNEKLYVTTTGCGILTVYDKKKNKRPVYAYEVLISKDVNARLNLLLDSKNRLWIAGVLPSNAEHSTLSLFHKEKKTLVPFEHQSLKDLKLQDYLITDMIEDRNKNIWLITFNGGLIQLNTVKNSLTQYIQSEEHPEYFSSSVIMNEVLEDRDGNLLIAAYGAGLYHFDTKTETLSHYNHGQLKDALIMHIAQDRHGWIWAEIFKKGIIIFDPRSPQKDIRHLDLENGLPTRSVTEILSDQEGQIWLNSLDGIWRYDEKLKSFIGFDEANTKSPNVFYKGFRLLNSGELLVGKTQGFNLFHPAKIHKNEIPPPIVLTKFMVFDTLRLFEKHINFQKKISLNYSDNFFTIAFAALNYSQPEKNKYAYKLEGYNKNWIYPSDNRPIANYTGVREGSYTFKVKASNNDGVWNEQGHSLEIKIKPPWWRSIWAYSFYLITFGSIIYTVYRFLLNRKLAEAETRRLKELDSLKTKLYTNITHEFRTPLTVIQGMADTMEGDLEAKKLIRRNSKNLLHLVTQLLDMSKLESGKMELKMIRRNVISYLSYLTASFQSLADTKRIELSFESEIPELVMDYDAEKIQHIIANLISNAIKFTQETGMVKVKVTKSPALLNLKHNPLLKISVKDNGIGIPEEHLPHIFNRFYQVDDTHTRRAAGTGIGLALTKELVEVMGGSISVKSEYAQGTEFEVLIPERHLSETQNENPEVAFDNDQNKTVISSEQPTVVLSTVSTPPNPDLPILLLIEDNADVVTYIKTCLKGLYNIHVAYNGQAGIDKAVEIIPDIIISDVMMPEKDGFEVTHFLKNDERTSHIPIIILTAKADVDSKLLGLTRGADVYLSKPFHKEELLIRLQKLIDLRHKLQARYSTLSPLPPSKDVAIQIEDAFLKKVREAVEANIDDANFNVARLCKTITLSQPQLYRKIKALTGNSISVFIRTIRLQKGKELLETTDLTVSEIAYDVGFTDPAYFSRTFSEAFGYPPSENRPS